jgi:uncharacterized protein YcsI (UPF0317 family)
MLQPVLNILFVYSNPFLRDTNTDIKFYDIDVDEELLNIRNEISTSGKKVNVSILSGCSWDRFCDIMLANHFDIIHFSMHALLSSKFVFEQHGRPQYVSIFGMLSSNVVVERT